MNLFSPIILLFTFFDDFIVNELLPFSGDDVFNVNVPKLYLSWL